MLVNDIILESYYDFVKDDNVEDIIDHAKSIKGVLDIINYIQAR